MAQMGRARSAPSVREPLRPASETLPAEEARSVPGLIPAPTAACFHNLHIIWDQGSCNCRSVYLLSSGTSSKSCLIACNSPVNEIPACGRDSTMSCRRLGGGVRVGVTPPCQTWGGSQHPNPRTAQQMYSLPPGMELLTLGPAAGGSGTGAHSCLPAASFTPPGPSPGPSARTRIPGSDCGAGKGRLHPQKNSDTSRPGHGRRRRTPRWASCSQAAALLRLPVLTAPCAPAAAPHLERSCAH